MSNLSRSLVFWIAAVGLTFGIPGPSFEVSRISGTVKAAVWRSSISIKRVTVLRDGGRENESISCPDEWIIVLRDVKGLTEDQKRWMRERFKRTFPNDDVSEFAGDKDLLIRINGSKDLPMKLNSQVNLSKIVFASDEGGAGMSYSFVDIDGKKFDSPPLVKK